MISTAMRLPESPFFFCTVRWAGTLTLVMIHFLYGYRVYDCPLAMCIGYDYNASFHFCIIIRGLFIALLLLLLLLLQYSPHRR